LYHVFEYAVVPYQPNNPQNQNNSQPFGYSQDFSVNPTNQPEFQSSRGYGFGRSGFFQNRRTGMSRLEIGIILVVVALLLTSIILGFVWQDTKNRDIARSTDISSILRALDNFYQNSSLDPDGRAYPKSTCSAKLNEVDYELNLRLALTGKKPNLDPHAYILPENFPRDRSGTYSKTVAQRSVAYRCPQLLSSQNSTDSIYSDNWESCNFNQTDGPRFCYLYTSTANGDTFELASFQESTKLFVIYKKFRDQPITQRVAS